MTDDKIALRELLEKGSDATFLREMIGFAAERLMALGTETLCGAAPDKRSESRTNQRWTVAIVTILDFGAARLGTIRTDSYVYDWTQTSFRVGAPPSPGQP